MTEIRPPSLYEKLLRKFNVLMQLVSLVPFYSLLVGCLALSLTPAIYFYQRVGVWNESHTGLKHALVSGIALCVCYLIYGFSVMIVAPTANFILRLNLKAWRGQYFSGPAVRWYFHNGLTYIVRYSFLEFVTPTPMSIWFYKLMGMKIGRGAQ